MFRSVGTKCQQTGRLPRTSTELGAEDQPPKKLVRYYRNWLDIESQELSKHVSQLFNTSGPQNHNAVLTILIIKLKLIDFDQNSQVHPDLGVRASSDQNAIHHLI